MVPIPLTAFVHDWLTTWGGGELVLEAMVEAVGPAPIYTLVWDPRNFGESLISKQEIRPSFLQHLPGGRANHRLLLPLMPLAVEQFDLRRYDLLISSSHVVAHGILPQPDQLHISYTNAPARYAWHLYHEYMDAAGLQPGPKWWLRRMIMHYLRLWDAAAAARVFEAWARVRASYPDVTLVLLGGAARVFRGRGFAEAPKGVLLAGYVADDDLPRHYGAAVGLVYASLYESFGLPCWKRWPVERRWSARTRRRCLKLRAMPRCSSIQPTWMTSPTVRAASSATGSSGKDCGRRGLPAPGSSIGM